MIPGDKCASKHTVPRWGVELGGSKGTMGVEGLHSLPSPRKEQNSAPRGRYSHLQNPILQEPGVAREPHFPPGPWVHSGGSSVHWAAPCSSQGGLRSPESCPLGTRHTTPTSRTPRSPAIPPLLPCHLRWSGAGKHFLTVLSTSADFALVA